MTRGFNRQFRLTPVDFQDRCELPSQRCPWIERLKVLCGSKCVGTVDLHLGEPDLEGIRSRSLVLPDYATSHYRSTRARRGPGRPSRNRSNRPCGGDVPTVSNQLLGILLRSVRSTTREAKSQRYSADALITATGSSGMDGRRTVARVPFFKRSESDVMGATSSTTVGRSER